MLAVALMLATTVSGEAVATPPCDLVERLAFVSNRDGGDLDIFVMDADGTDMRQLTYNEVDEGHPVWSPDGEWIAFDRVAGPKDLTDEDAPRDLFVVRADGTGERNVTRTPDVHEGTPAWSPDGQRLAFHTRRDGDFEIYAVDLDGTHWDNLTNHHPETPDATGRAGADVKPSWAADGRIVFESYRDEAGLNSDIWVMNDDGSDQQLLVATPFPRAEWFPSWSPDGRHVAYMSGGDGAPFDIYTVRDDGREVTNVSRTPKTEDNPSWSPDGQRIAFGSNLGDAGLDTRVYAAEWYQSGGGITDNFEIYTTRVDGTGLTRLTDHPAADTDPSYRPRPIDCRAARQRSRSMGELTVSPREALVDEVVGIRVDGLVPRQEVVIGARTESIAAEARATFIADDHGAVDVSRQAPVRGDYEGCDPMGLFWSATLDDRADFMAVHDCLSTIDPVTTTITADAGGTAIGEVTLTRMLIAPDVTRTVVREGRLRATLFAQAGAAGRPGVIVCGGSDGGNPESTAALLGSRGFAALSLAYFSYEDLPEDLVEIPLEYFGEAIAWLTSRPEVSGPGVGVIGTSRGGELALLLGATFPQIRAVVALVPSGVMWGGVGPAPNSASCPSWTFRGVALPTVPNPDPTPDDIAAYEDAATHGTPIVGSPMVVRALEHPDASRAEIEVEKTNGPILLLSGEDDETWPSTRLAEIAVERLKARSFSYEFEHVSYPAAGHMACLLPYFPTTRNWGLHPRIPLPFSFGGSPAGTAAAQGDSWKRAIEFLTRHLRP